MGVHVKLAGSLVARTGADSAYVAVPDDATVTDVVEGLADQFGQQVRPGLLAGDRLRADTIAVREAPPGGRLTTNSRVRPGETVRFELVC